MAKHIKKALRPRRRPPVMAPAQPRHQLVVHIDRAFGDDLRWVKRSISRIIGFAFAGHWARPFLVHWNRFAGRYAIDGDVGQQFVCGLFFF